MTKKIKKAKINEPNAKIARQRAWVEATALIHASASKWVQTVWSIMDADVLETFSRRRSERRVAPRRPSALRWRLDGLTVRLLLSPQPRAAVSPVRRPSCMTSFHRGAMTRLR